ncbi:MAG: hypothetical protein BZ136_07755 [Methanosphaera sp. rholeuAM74]|nr:MAG: hypothetical protein BZ136_07755 [Methanosphaera sp. rholeuAM74]
MGKRVSLNINEKVWDKYISKLEEETGSSKGKGFISPTIENLIEKYYLNDDLEKRIKLLEDENEKLKETNDSQINSEVYNLKKKISVLEEENERLKRNEIEEDKSQSRLNKLKKQFEELDKDYSNLSEKFDSLTNENETMSSSLSTVRNDLDDITKKNNDLEVNYAKLKGENENLLMKISLLEESEVRLNATIEKQEELIKINKVDADNVRQDYENIKGELEQKRKEYVKLSNDKNHSDQRQRQLQEEVNSLEIKENNYRMVMKQLDAMSLMDRLLGRYPEDIKELKR